MSTQEKPLNICGECVAGRHGNCLRIPGKVVCECPHCWHDRQDSLTSKFKQTPATPKHVVAPKMRPKIHPRLRVRIGRIGGGGALDNK